MSTKIYSDLLKPKQVKAAMEELPEDRKGNGEAAGDEPQEGGTEGPQIPLPLFYKNPQHVHNVRHAG